MLRNILFIQSSAGILLFNKDFVKSEVGAGMMAGLVTSMGQLASERTGLPASYIELSNVSISIAESKAANVTCALFFDSEQGRDFGDLLCTEFLLAFVSMFTSPSERRVSPNEDFRAFNIKIAETIRGAVRPILDNLGHCRGIRTALATQGDEITYSTDDKVDKYGVLANITSLVSGARDIMSTQTDAPRQMSFRGARTTIVIVLLNQTSLVVICKNQVKQELWEADIRKSARLLEKVLNMASYLQDENVFQTLA